MRVKAPLKAPPPVFSWTGWYVGLNAGGIWSNSSDTVEPTGCFVTAPLCGGALTNNPLRTDTGNLNHKAGFTGGGQFGYNWQSGPAVFGLETDFNFSSLNTSDGVNRALAAPLVGNIVHTVNEKLDWFGTFRGRWGFTQAPTWLIYATGGLAYGHISSSSNIAFVNAGITNDTYVGSVSTTRVGWTVGGGTEWMFAPGWSAKAEYLFVDLGSVRYTDACITPAICGGFTPAATYQTDLRLRDNIFRGGINYHFGGPVVAKY
jgi:outer membrane immunogenic protein